MNPIPKCVEWIGEKDGYLRLIDQTRLPGELVFHDCRTVEDVWHAIKRLEVRGAPAIGVAAAYAMVLAAQKNPAGLHQAAKYLKSSRPTAVNLAWAVDRMFRFANGSRDPLTKLLLEAHAIRDEDSAMCRAIGRNGADLLPESGGVLTHCNAGGLATAEYGTALGVIRAAWDSGKRFTVFADETRPLLQGARLTCWELCQLGIDHLLVTDNMAGLLMRQGKINAVVVGADRIAANGDTANKIGTYTVAVLAKHHGIPLYVAAPSSTFDLALTDGSIIPIEERSPDEIKNGFGMETAPRATPAFNPAFDVTPADLIAGIITERGVIAPVNPESIRTHLSISQKWRAAIGRFA